MKINIKLFKTFLGFKHIIFFIVLCTSCNAQNKKSNQIIGDGAELVLISNDFEFTEGPATDKEGNVFFTDQPNDRILKWDAKTNLVSEYMKPSGRSNGLYFDNNGNLLSAADKKNELWRIKPNKEVTVLVDNYEHKKLNGPNDLWVNATGGIYFTDPYYQRDWWSHKKPQQKENRVYYLAPNTDKPIIVSNDNYVQPNGLIGSKDGRKLYVADQADNKTFVFDVQENGNLTNRKLFTTMGSDGMTIDNKGNIYLTGTDGVTVFNVDGEKIQQIAVPQGWTANVTFGGKNQKKLFITAMSSVYTLEMNVQGVRYAN
ncbi:SMP-30/gluconolactonase/LRE family protein [Polaribacter sp. Z014]|uniref:SMP-30/gluconolactonase/LRE family protein n=1 Tax=Polaribacter sp. Z014 TaxID=2927126 RepID=UPI00201FED10|nr:SMP-30/gluconolactonase/LRE family protein [Polaribacter sp. Z014]MCL7764734.1 SMP-30/gluconolactonase/LRE family protein [Polaribacter sp. Z014]